MGPRPFRCHHLPAFKRPPVRRPPSSSYTGSTLLTSLQMPTTSHPGLCQRFQSDVPPRFLPTRMSLRHGQHSGPPFPFMLRLLDTLGLLLSPDSVYQQPPMPSAFPSAPPRLSAPIEELHIDCNERLMGLMSWCFLIGQSPPTLHWGCSWLPGFRMSKTSHKGHFLLHCLLWGIRHRFVKTPGGSHGEGPWCPAHSQDQLGACVSELP